MAFVLETLNEAHDRSAFSCGRDDRLDLFCRDNAFRDHETNFLRVRVAVDENGVVVGFHALTADSIKQASLGYYVGRREKKIPVIHLAMIAVCQNHQGGDVGAALVRDIFESVASAADQIGACCLYLEAACEALVPHYEGWGFARLSSRSLAMYMPLATVRDALVPADNDDAEGAETEAA